MSEGLRFRQIHLDFHTSPCIPDVGRDFDPDEFADTMARAHVDSVTVFAKCHHGHLYYDTGHPARHPGLKPGLDLLAGQVDALHRRNIKAPVYISVQCDEFAANTHPEWRVVNPDGSLAGNPLVPGWHICDMSSPYQDYLAEQIAEVLDRFAPLDGCFLDMCWDQQSVSTWALAGMVRAGLAPLKEEDRARYAHQVTHQYMRRYTDQINAAHKKNAKVRVWFNSRPLTYLPEEKKFLHHVEVEALATGGWGYTYFPLNIRFVRNYGMPTLGMTARFHKSWADFGGLKPEAALMYECVQSLANGACCSIGDQLHPRGTLDPAAYDLIGRVYSHVESCEPWCRDAKPVTEIAVVRPLSGTYHAVGGDALEGTVRALQQLRHQFDYLAPEADFSKYRLVIVPECATVDKALAARLLAFAKKGGKVILSGKAALGADGGPALGDAQGIRVSGDSPYQTTYLRFDGPLADGIPATDHVMYERGFRMKAAPGAKGYVHVVEPYFDRAWNHFSSHFQTPPDKKSPYVALVLNGNIATIAFPVFQAYATHGNLPYRHLIGKTVEMLMPDPLVKAGGPSFLEVTLNRQGTRSIAHCVAYCPQRRAQMDIVEDATDVRDLPLSVKLPKAPKSATLQPSGQGLIHEYRDGRANVDGNGGVDGTDLNTLINIILGK